MQYFMIYTLNFECDIIVHVIIIDALFMYFITTLMQFTLQHFQCIEFKLNFLYLLLYMNDECEWG